MGRLASAGGEGWLEGGEGLETPLSEVRVHPAGLGLKHRVETLGEKKVKSWYFEIPIFEVSGMS
jgi:hypothetical protein